MHVTYECNRVEKSLFEELGQSTLLVAMPFLGASTTHPHLRCRSQQPFPEQMLSHASKH
jgi:hypothetical protein